MPIGRDIGSGFVAFDVVQSLWCTCFAAGEWRHPDGALLAHFAVEEQRLAIRRPGSGISGPIEGENRFRLDAAIGGHPPNRGVALRAGGKGDAPAVGGPNGSGRNVSVSQPYFGATLHVKNPNGALPAWGPSARAANIDCHQTPIG